MENFLLDIRYGIRMLLKNRGYTIVAILALTLGIGANTAIFSVVNAVLLRSLPYPDSDRLVRVWDSDLELTSKGTVSAANFLDWREQNQVFEEMAAYRRDSIILNGSDRPENVEGLIANVNLFKLLGVKPFLGRTFLPEEEKSGEVHVAIMSYRLWSSRYGSDSAIIGRNLKINGKDLTIVGVMPAGFDFSGEVDIWLPPRQVVPEYVLKPAADMTTDRTTGYFAVIGRLKPGITIERAQAEMNIIASRLEKEYPNTNTGRRVRLVRLRDELVADIEPTLLVLSVAVAFVLLIACSNVANLLLARAATQQKEIAIRSAIGASRWRLIRQLLTESLLLGAIGGATGLLLAMWGKGPLIDFLPADLYGLKEVRIETRVLGFTFALSILTSVLFGLVPALQASKIDLNESLKEGGRSSNEGSHRNRTRSLLVVSEIALSLVLLIGAGLMLKSFMRLQMVDPGFETRGILTTRLWPTGSRYKEKWQQAAFFQQVLQRMEVLHGVQSAALISRLPLTSGNSDRDLTIEGQTNVDPQNGPVADYRVISANYFRVMGIPLLKGRVFTERDNAESHGVAIINEKLAKSYFNGEDPIGKRFQISGDKDWIEIVGVVGNVRHFGLDREVNPEFYVPYLKYPWPFMNVVVRTASNSPDLTNGMRNAVWEVDKDLPVSQIVTVEQLLSKSFAWRRSNMLLLGIFAAIAFLLAAVGIYGVISYTVAQHTHEIGIRIALGAQASDVLKLVVGQGIVLAAIGVAIGLVAAFALTRLMADLVYGVSTTDPATFVIVSILLAGVALLASYIPARRATKVDPLVALRYE